MVQWFTRRGPRILIIKISWDFVETGDLPVPALACLFSPSAASESLRLAEDRRRRGRQRMRWLDGITDSWTWVWVGSGSWWWTGKPGVLEAMGLQSRTRLSDWTELRAVAEPGGARAPGPGLSSEQGTCSGTCRASSKGRVCVSVCIGVCLCVSVYQCMWVCLSVYQCTWVCIWVCTCENVSDEWVRGSVYQYVSAWGICVRVWVSIVCLCECVSAPMCWRNQAARRVARTEMGRQI